MTLQEYKYWFFKTYGHENIGQTGCGGPALTFMTMLLALFLFCSCRTQYVPIETTHTIYQNHTDTIRERDSVHTETNTIIREADSAMVADLGLKLKDNERAILILRNELQRVISEKEQHSTDTVHKTDSVQVPYPVPAQLSRWQSFCCDYGKVMLGTTLVLFVLLIILTIKHLKKKSNVFV